MPVNARHFNGWPVIILLLILLLAAIYRYQVSKNATQDDIVAIGDNSNILLGNPSHAVHSISSPDNYLINHIYYVESYNRDKGTPNWVSWHLEASDLGNTNRSSDYRPDNNLPAGWYNADAESYKNSGFDKGHNCPSGDRTATAEINATTFLMDNMIPQAPNNNEHTWEHLERYCREQVQKGNEAFIMMGNYGSGGTGRKGYKTTIAGGNINVPAHIWKVVIILPAGNNDLARINNDTPIIAVDTPNENNLSANWMNYVTTVSNIEKNCGCDLLSALPVDVQRVLENKKFTGGN